MEACIAFPCAPERPGKIGRVLLFCEENMRLIFYSLLIISLCSVIWAEGPTPNDTEDQPYEESIIITADKLAEPLENAGSTVTVITREEIEQRHEPFLLDLFRSVPGVYISQSGSVGKQTSIFIRGAGSAQALVMIDGVQINDSLNFVDLGTLTTTNIERIEIVRGPQSTLYGSDAMGGVVNIITRNAGNLISAKGEFGSDSTSIASVRSGYGSTENNIAAEYGYYFTDGQTTNDDYENKTLAINGHVQITDWTNLGVTFRDFDTDLGIPLNSGVPSPNRRQKTNADLFNVPLTQKVTGWWDVSANFSIFDEEIHFQDPDDPFGFTFSDSDSRTTTFNVVNNFRATNGHAVLGGYEHEKIKINDASPFSVLEGEITNDAIYGQYQYSGWKGLTVTAGIRADHNSAFGDDTNPRLAVSYQASDAIRLHGSVGTGFRAPRPAELFPPFGNPELQPEEVTGWDLGINYQVLPEYLILSGTFFYNDFKNLIAFGTVRLENFEKVKTSGLELEARIQPARNLTIQGTYTFLDTEDQITREELLRRPRNSGSFNVNYALKRMNANFNWNFVGDRFDIDDSDFFFPRVNNPGFNKADLVVSYDLIQSLQIYGRITNIFDEEYQEVFGFPSPDRAFYAGVRLNY
jgi:vitamin B12 transporter